jgi:hypothetical protein
MLNSRARRPTDATLLGFPCVTGKGEGWGIEIVYSSSEPRRKTERTLFSVRTRIWPGQPQNHQGLRFAVSNLPIGSLHLSRKHLRIHKLPWSLGRFFWIF